MTRATYNATDNTLKEQPTMEKPLKPIYRRQMEPYYREIAEYNAHIATLRTIPCSPECRGLWKEGQVLEESVHYRLIEDYWRPETEEEYKEACMVARNELPAKPPKVLRVIPLPVKSEDDLWDDVVNVLCPDYHDTEKVDGLKSKYIITKR